jgi:hypothetical protein
MNTFELNTLTLGDGERNRYVWTSSESTAEASTAGRILLHGYLRSGLSVRASGAATIGGTVYLRSASNAVAEASGLIYRGKALISASDAQADTAGARLQGEFCLSSTLNVEASTTESICDLANKVSTRSSSRAVVVQRSQIHRHRQLLSEGEASALCIASIERQVNISSKTNARISTSGLLLDITRRDAPDDRVMLVPEIDRVMRVPE